MSIENNCPFCNSEQIEWDSEKGLYFCFDCDEEWSVRTK